MTDFKIGIQLYAVRDHFLTDMPGTLKSLSEMGYQEVEGFWVYPCRAAELDKMLKDNGLSMCGWHVGLDHLTVDKYMATLEYHDRIGNRILGLNAGPEMLDNPDKIKSLRDQMLEASDRLAAQGFILEYHNHWWELESGAYYELMDDCSLHAQFDMGNALKGGVHVADLLGKYSGRLAAAHMKPYSLEKGFECVIGDQNDSVRWQDIISALDKEGVEHLTIEYESVTDQMELAQKNIQGLKKILGRS